MAGAAMLNNLTQAREDGRRIAGQRPWLGLFVVDVMRRAATHLTSRPTQDGWGRLDDCREAWNALHWATQNQRSRCDEASAKRLREALLDLAAKATLMATEGDEDLGLAPGRGL